MRLWGWRISLPASQLPPKYVLIAVPHTSNWDFPLGLLARSALGLDIKYLGKASLFESPLGRLFRWLGGYPVDRSGGLGYVETVARIFDEHESFAICIAPEGTRKKVERLKTGFYYSLTTQNFASRLLRGVNSDLLFLPSLSVASLLVVPPRPAF